MLGVGHFWEILILLVIVLLVFGPGKLPEVGSALGRGIREFKDATSGLGNSLSSSQNDTYQPPVISQTPPAAQVPPVQQWQAPVTETREHAMVDSKPGDR